MAALLLTPQNFNQNEAQNLRLHQLASAPSSPVEGQVYHDTALHVARYWNGSVWVEMDAALTSTAPVALGTAAAGTGTTAARNDHVHPTTGLALVGAANTFTTGTQTVQGALVVSGGNFQVDSSGRIGLEVAVSTDTQVLTQNAHPSGASTIFGFASRQTAPATATNAFSGYISALATAASSFTLGTLRGYYADAPTIGSTSAVTTAIGHAAANQGVSGVTNAYGLRTDAQSGAGTLNVGARIDTGTTAALWLGGNTTATDVTGGIAFGSGRDVTVYRSAANALTIAASSLTTLTGSLAVGTTPASGGLVRLPSAQDIDFRNNANSADVRLIGSNSSDQVVLDQISGAGVQVRSSILIVADSNYATAGAIRMANAQALNARNAANNANITLAQVDSSNVLQLGAGAASIGLNSLRVTNAADPTSAQDLATKNYVDLLAQGLSPKPSVTAATTAALAANTYSNGTAGVGATLTANANGALPSQDGVALWTDVSQAITGVTNSGTTVTFTVASTAGMAAAMPVTVAGVTGFTTNNPNGNWNVLAVTDATHFTAVVTNAPTGSYVSGGTVTATAARLIVKNEVTTANNGIYKVTNLGSASTAWVLTRALDMDTSTEFDGAYAFVESGTANGSTQWGVTGDAAVTVGTTGVVWTQIAGPTLYTVSSPITLTGTQIGFSASYAGQSSITTLGTIGTGAWQGTAVGVLYGGTGATTAAGARSNLSATGRSSGTIGNGSSTSIAYNHALGQQYVTVQVFDATSNAQVFPDVTLTDANNVTLTFSVAPTTNQYRVVVVG